METVDVQEVGELVEADQTVQTDDADFFWTLDLVEEEPW
jgi:hypothetical protein